MGDKNQPPNIIFCSLRATCPGGALAAGWEKKGELATTSMEFAASFPVVLGGFGCAVTSQACWENSPRKPSRNRTRFQASYGNSDSANWPGYEALEFECRLQFPCGSPSTELSDFRQSAWSGNERECRQTLTNKCQEHDVITNVISANQHFAPTFSKQIFKFQRRSCKPFFLYRRAAWALRRACSQAIFFVKISATFFDERQA